MYTYWENQHGPPCTLHAPPPPTSPPSPPPSPHEEPTTMVPKYTLGVPNRISLGPRTAIGMHLSFSPLHKGTPLRTASHRLFTSHEYNCFVTRWPKCKCICWFLPHLLEQTYTKFRYSFSLGEDLHADTVCHVPEWSLNTTICAIVGIWHVPIAYVSIILF